MTNKKNTALMAILFMLIGAFFAFGFYPHFVKDLFYGSPKKKVLTQAELSTAPLHIQQEAFMQDLKNQKPMNLDIITPFVDELYNVFQTSGSIVCQDSVAIKVEEPGLVDDIVVRTGSFVKKGDILFSLRKKKAQANRDNALAELKYRRAETDRYETLIKTNAIALNKLQEARAHYEKALAALVVADVTLECCAIRAPFDGTVGLIRISPGQYLSPHQGSGPAETLYLADTSQLYVEFAVNSAYSDILFHGKEVELEFKTRENHKTIVKAIIEDIDVKIDQNQTLKARARLQNNSKNIILPGQYVHVSMRYNEKKGIALPKDCFSVDSYGKYYVFICIEENDMKIAQAMPVDIGLINDELQIIEIKDMRLGMKFVRHVSRLPSSIVRVA